jgi:hypothetical protein
MRAFYWRLLRRTPILLFQAGDRVVTGAGLLLATVAALNGQLATTIKASADGFSPAWGFVPVGLVFLYGLLRANYEAHTALVDERDDAVAKLSEQFVSQTHADELRMALTSSQAALRARGIVSSLLENPIARNFERERFAAHFPELTARLDTWNDVKQRCFSAPRAVEARIRREIEKRQLDQYPYSGDVLVKSLSRVAIESTLDGKAIDPISLPLSDGSIWAMHERQGPSGVNGFLLEIPPHSAGHFPIEVDCASRDEALVEAAALVQPVNSLLLEVQEWPESADVATTQAELDAFPVRTLLDDLEAAKQREALPVAQRCPRCGILQC